MPKALRSCRSGNTPFHSFSWPPTQPYAARAPRHFSEYHTLRQSRILHARHKPREQGPPPECSCIDALTSHLDISVSSLKIRWSARSLCSSTDAAASQGAVVSSAQRVVVARARAPRDAAIQHCLECLGSEHYYTTVAISARGLLNREKKNKRKVIVWQRTPCPPPPTLLVPGK